VEMATMTMMTMMMMMKQKKRRKMRRRAKAKATARRLSELTQRVPREVLVNVLIIRIKYYRHTL
jgi:hypothetical protein